MHGNSKDMSSNLEMFASAFSKTTCMHFTQNMPPLSVFQLKFSCNPFVFDFVNQP
jgi:hypothetical protein